MAFAPAGALLDRAREREGAEETEGETCVLRALRHRLAQPAHSVAPGWPFGGRSQPPGGSLPQQFAHQAQEPSQRSVLQ